MTKRKVKKIDYDSQLISKDLSIYDWLEKMEETEPCITVNDHMEDFSHKLSFSLIYSSKSNIRKIRKNVLDKINKSLISSTNANQWKNTTSVITGLKKIPKKEVPDFFNLM